LNRDGAAVHQALVNRREFRRRAEVPDGLAERRLTTPWRQRWTPGPTWPCTSRCPMRDRWCCPPS